MRNHLVLGIALVVVTAGWLLGSITLTGAGSTLVAPPAVRQGVYVSPDVALPTNGITTLTVAFDGIPDADYENPANSFVMTIEASVDGVATWRPVAGFEWVSPGKPFIDQKTGIKNPVNAVTFGVQPWLAQGLTHLRANVTIPNAMTAGVTVTLQ